MHACSLLLAPKSAFETFIFFRPELVQRDFLAPVHLSFAWNKVALRQMLGPIGLSDLADEPGIAGF